MIGVCLLSNFFELKIRYVRYRMVFRCKFKVEVFSDGFWDVDFVESIYGIFVYGSSEPDCDNYEGVYFPTVIS